MVFCIWLCKKWFWVTEEWADRSSTGARYCVWLCYLSFVPLKSPRFCCTANFVCKALNQGKVSIFPHVIFLWHHSPSSFGMALKAFKSSIWKTLYVQLLYMCCCMKSGVWGATLPGWSHVLLTVSGIYYLQLVVYWVAPKSGQIRM